MIIVRYVGNLDLDRVSIPLGIFHDIPAMKKSFTKCSDYFNLGWRGELVAHTYILVPGLFSKQWGRVVGRWEIKETDDECVLVERSVK